MEKGGEGCSWPRQRDQGRRLGRFEARGENIMLSSVKTKTLIMWIGRIYSGDILVCVWVWG